MGQMLESLKKAIVESRTVIVYGAGQNAGPALSWLVESDVFKGIDIHIAVTKAESDTYFNNYLVEEIGNLVQLNEKAIVLVSVFKGFYGDITHKLQELHFQHIFYLEEWFVKEAYYDIFWRYPIQGNKVLVENFHGRGYGDSPKYIVQELLKRTDKLDIVWVIKPGNVEAVPEGVRTVEIYSKKYFFETATSHVWISNVRKYQPVRKRDGQYYIQTWHGFPLKKIEKDAEEISHGISGPYFDAGKKDSEMIDLLISNAVFLTKIFQQTFWYAGEISETGTPRNDIFFRRNSEASYKVKRYFGVDFEAKTVLYVPTFRSSYIENPIDIDIEKILLVLESMQPAKWTALIRMHPNMVKKSEQYIYSDSIVNATFYPDIMELLAAADVLITDYSSAMFDYMLTGRPCFLYVKDLERYKENDRGFYFAFEKLPFPKAGSNQELVQIIKNFNSETYVNEVSHFKEEMGFLDDGHASERIADIVLEKTGFTGI